MKRKVLIVLEEAQSQAVTVEFQAEPAGADSKVNLQDIKGVTIPAGELTGERELPVPSERTYKYWVKGDDLSRA